jgi:hypothetical protein
MTVILLIIMVCSADVTVTRCHHDLRLRPVLIAREQPRIERANSQSNQVILIGIED